MKLIDELKWAKGKSTKCGVNKTSFPTFASFLSPSKCIPSFIPASTIAVLDRSFLNFRNYFMTWVSGVEWSGVDWRVGWVQRSHENGRPFLQPFVHSCRSTRKTLHIALWEMSPNHDKFKVPIHL